MQLDFFDVPSPCRGVCTTDAKGYCQGCMRTREERFGWNDFDVEKKQKVIKLCRQREKRKVAKEMVKDEIMELQPSDDMQSSLFDSPAEPVNTVDMDFKDFEL